jgi:hypothetical protein
MRKRIVWALSLCLIGIGAFGALAAAEVVQVGNMTLTVDGGFKPTKLPKKEMAPISLQAEGHLRTDDGTTPPVTDHVVVDFDENGTVDTKGLPTCDARKLENTLTKDALNKCKSALVGKGDTQAIVDFPDQEPFTARGPLLIFNGKPKGKKPTIIFHVFAHVPAPTTFVVPAVIENSPLNGFGKRIEIDVPPISGGNGTLVDFDANVKRTWKDKKGKHSYLIARCANGRFVANAHVTMRDGRELDVGIVRECQQK